jgi:predicted metal-dependent phosphoesterase TrpH
MKIFDPDNNDLRKFLNSLDTGSFRQNVDLHIHTDCSDGELSVQNTVEKVFNEGFKIISITDHNTVEAYNRLDLSNYDDLTIVKGVEFDCWYGYTLLHILGYGINTENQELFNLCAKNKISTELDIVRFYNKRKTKNVIQTIKNTGGIPILAHPACCWNINIEKMVKKLIDFGLEGLEVYYPYKRHRGIIKFYTINHIKKIADDLHLIKTGGSDRHC